MTTEATPGNVRLNDGLGHTDPARDAFERHVLQWTGQDMAYHHRNQTTGLEFAWHCWQAGAADAVAQGHACTFAIDNGGVLYRRHKAPQCASVEAVMDTRTVLGVCALQEDDFPALYALQGHRVRLVDLGPNVQAQAPAR